jgi:hypothetical protein
VGRADFTLKQVLATFGGVAEVRSLFNSSGEMRVKSGPIGIASAAVFALMLTPSIAGAQAPQKAPAVINPAPSAQDWADIAKLPDWSGVWNPKITDQDAQVKTNPPPWNEAAAKKIQHMFA